MTEEQRLAYLAAGQRIKDARSAAGLSQESLAMDSDLDQSTLSKIERMGPRIVSWKKLEALAEALGCVVDVRLQPKEP
ncbi:MAG: helix-turn-helix domain-containing protein [Proteobacteria bacterium]|nr:helix-turn-helix domain-containing protein [Pseudomonadota bacterium]